jgi:hypothetical protein
MHVPRHSFGTTRVLSGWRTPDATEGNAKLDVYFSKPRHDRRCWVSPPLTEHRLARQGMGCQLGKVARLLPTYAQRLAQSQPITRTICVAVAVKSSWRCLGRDQEVCVHRAAVEHVCPGEEITIGHVLLHGGTHKAI